MNDRSHFASDLYWVFVGFSVKWIIFHNIFSKLLQELMFWGMRQAGILRPGRHTSMLHTIGQVFILCLQLGGIGYPGTLLCEFRFVVWHCQNIPRINPKISNKYFWPVFRRWVASKLKMLKNLLNCSKIFPQ